MVVFVIFVKANGFARVVSVYFAIAFLITQGIAFFVKKGCVDGNFDAILGDEFGWRDFFSFQIRGDIGNDTLGLEIDFKDEYLVRRILYMAVIYAVKNFSGIG